ncbi:unnamed protein product [Rotaria sordida]|uniref:Peptidase S59 domain-containing protein n=1 Tax=Rotaria sordida TaxID=392033 RepID=A0A813UUJ9_9BILA|nr:unnamed protein product [Rotaria sordida]CAF0834084.1 unnamed protein product [Rotaria sordida]
MFIFTGKTPASTTAVNSTFTFSPATGSQPPITSGTSSVPQPFTFTAGAQNTLTANQFGNSSTSTTPANFTPANFGGTSIFGTNQAVPATQPTNIFASNATGTPFKFGPVSTQATSSIASTTSTMSNSNNTSATTIPSLFGTTTNPGPFGTATTNLAPFGTTTNPSPFGAATTNLAPFGTTTSGPVGTTTSGPFITTTNSSPFGTATTNLAPFGTTTSGPFGTTTSGPFGRTTSGPFGTTTNPGPFGTATANSAPFGTTTTNPTLFGTTTSGLFGTTNSMKYTTSGSLSNQAFLATAGTSTTPFAPGTNTALTMNAFRTSNPTQTNLVGTATSGVPITTSGFGSTILTKPLDVQSNTTQTLYNFPPNTNTSTSFKFGPPTAANTSILPQSTTATSQNSTFPITTTNNINVPTTTTIPFSFLSSATNIFQTNAPATTTTSTFNPSLFTGLPVTQNQPTMTSSSSTMISQVQKQEQNTEQSISTIQQQFLAASLLDPYANRGKKDFSSIDQIKVPIEPAVVSTLPATTVTATVTTSTPMPNTLSIQANFRKGSSSHSLVDINFKLKPVSSSPTLNDTIKPSNQQSTISTGQMKSTLKENFTDEEELVLLGQTKISKLRLSNAIIDPSYQSNSIRSLYPSRRLVELENLINIRPPSSPKTTVNNQRISHSANENRDLSPNHHSNSSIVSPQSSSPIIQRKAKQNSQDYHLPILTRNNYYMKPTISELKSLFNDNGECILSQFTVGHEKYGSVTFYGQINVTGLNLDEIIEINRHEVIVYPDDNNKPLVGKELNLPARITLLDVYPIDRSTREEITDIERIKALNYDDYLRTITKKFDGEFINYGIHDGSWTFTVKHFTRYGLDDNQNDFIVKSKIVNQPIITSNFIEYDETM